MPRLFVPRNKPKSWVLGILSGLIGLLAASPIMFIGAYFEFKFIKSFGMGLFFICWFTFAFSWLIFVIGLLGGKYRNIQEQEWGKQLW
jgi:hypothetical protein